MTEYDENGRPQGTTIYMKNGVYMGMKDNMQTYPGWRYHKFFEPKIVRNTDEDLQAGKDGWKTPDVPITAAAGLVNWNHDLEDMNADQLRLFALEEYGVEFPEEADAEKLVKAIWHLARAAPDKGRMTLLAQSVKMNLDETIDQIKKDVTTKDMEYGSYTFEA